MKKSDAAWEKRLAELQENTRKRLSGAMVGVGQPSATSKISKAYQVTSVRLPSELLARLATYTAATWNKEPARAELGKRSYHIEQALELYLETFSDKSVTPTLK